MIEAIPYVVVRALRFQGRSYSVGDALEPWRLCISHRDLRDLLAKGYIERQEHETDPED